VLFQDFPAVFFFNLVLIREDGGLDANLPRCIGEPAVPRFFIQDAVKGIAVKIPKIVFDGSPGFLHAQFQGRQGAEPARRGGGRPEGDHIELGEEHVDFCQVLAGEFDDPHARIGTVFN